MRRLRWIVLAAALLAAGCGRGLRGPASIDPELVSLAPADTVTLAGLRPEALRATPLWKKWVAGRSFAPLDELARETGLDLRQDVSEALLASTGKDGVVLARGRFAKAELEAGLERRGAKRSVHRGVTLVGDQDAAVAVLSSSLVVAGSTGLVRSVIEQRGRGGPPRALLDEARGIAADSQIWVVSAGLGRELSKGALPPGAPGNLGKIVEMVERVSLAADLRTGLNARGALVCRSEQDARTLSEALRGLIGLARLSTPDNEPDLLRVWDAIQVNLAGRTVHLRAQVAPDLLDKLLGTLPGAASGALKPGFQLPRLP